MRDNAQPTILFHAELGPFAGGFVGVDIFFVISGYLITRFIVAEMDRGAFSIATLYKRRVRRLFPGLGTALILYAREHARPAINRLLAQRPIVFIGLISYSVYLWHWPIFVYVRYYAIEKLTTLDSLGLLLLSLAVGALSWRTIEMPFRKGGGWRIRTPIFRLSSGVMVLSIFAGGSIYAANGLPDRFPKQTQRLSDYALSMNPVSARARAGAGAVSGLSRGCLLQSHGLHYVHQWPTALFRQSLPADPGRPYPSAADKSGAALKRRR